MKRTLACIALFVAIISCSTVGMAGEPHYVNGVEGIKAATIPPPGVYGRLYSIFYTANTMKDGNGDKMDVGLDLKVYAIAPRLVWVTPVKILGGDYFTDLVVPIVKSDLSMDALHVDDGMTGVGDISFDPLGIAWHGALYDAAVGVGGYIPSGGYAENNPASVGKDMWTALFTAGGTVYADVEKTWSASILARYEIHTEQKEEDYTPGNDFHFEWGLGKTLLKTIDVGLSGYCYWQTTDDSDKDTGKARVFAAGPEVGGVIPYVLVAVSARALWEFEARNQTEGALYELTLTKRF